MVDRTAHCYRAYIAVPQSGSFQVFAIGSLRPGGAMENDSNRHGWNRWYEEGPLKGPLGGIDVA